MFDLLIKYKEREGHCNVPKKHEEDGKKLGDWLDKQIRNKNKGQLDPGLEQQLKDVGVTWNNQNLDPWEKNYELLRKFKEREGHMEVPSRHEEEGRKLGAWLNKQRLQRRKGKLDSKLEKRLEDIGILWDANLEQWEKNYQLLVKFQEREGHSDVPQKYEEDGIKLGAWLDKQRGSKKKGQLDKALEERLKERCIAWEPRLKQWEKNYQLLVQFRCREGHGNVPYYHEEGEIKLGLWLREQRRNKRKGKLDESFQKRLEAMGVAWDPLLEKQEMNHRLLVKFQEREGHCNVPVRYEEDGIKLGIWLDTQRQKKKRRKLDPETEKRLEEMGVTWDPLSEQWEKNYKLLLKFQQREGHSNVPKSYEENGLKLGRWLSTQKENRRKGKLDPSREKQLEVLNVKWEILAEK